MVNKATAICRHRLAVAGPGYADAICDAVSCVSFGSFHVIPYSLGCGASWDSSNILAGSTAILMCQHWLSNVYGLGSVCVCLSTTSTSAGTLPENWAGAEAFPLLTDLTLADLPFQAGTLPAAWANNASFPQLTSLQLGLSELDSVSLSGSLPPEWGNPGAYQNLQSLILGGSFIGTHSLAMHSAHMHDGGAQIVEHACRYFTVNVNFSLLA